MRKKPAGGDSRSLCSPSALVRSPSYDIFIRSDGDDDDDDEDGWSDHYSDGTDDTSSDEDVGALRSSCVEAGRHEGAAHRPRSRGAGADPSTDEGETTPVTDTTRGARTSNMSLSRSSPRGSPACGATSPKSSPKDSTTTRGRASSEGSPACGVSSPLSSPAGTPSDSPPRGAALPLRSSHGKLSSPKIASRSPVASALSARVPTACISGLGEDSCSEEFEDSFSSNASSDDASGSDDDWLGEGSSAAHPLSKGAAGHAVPRAGSTAAAPVLNTRRTLYIQMEYCKRTLDELLQEGQMNEQTIWRTLRQLLIGLQHVHAQGIVHRDLKPQNIFLDFGDNCKLGDFGLATRRTGAGNIGSTRVLNGLDRSAAGGNSTITVGDVVDGAQLSAVQSTDGSVPAPPSEATADVGTYLYMDPYAAGSTNSFALDIWSLGVILFELCTYFPTRMERIIALTELREGRTPDAAFVSRWPAQAALMREMLDPVAERRPSARKLLERLPPQEDDENLKNALRVLSQPHSEYYALLMENLFAPQRVLLPPLAQGEDDGLIPGTGLHRAYCSPLLLQPPAYMLDLQRGHELLASVFRRHGAIELCLPPLWLKQTPVAAGSPETLAAYLIESGGHIVGLHTGGRQPLCQYLSIHAPLTTFKRYSQGVAHRLPPPSNKPPALRFTAQLVADFDIVAAPYADAAADLHVGSPASGVGNADYHVTDFAGATSSTAKIIESEVIRVASEVLHTFSLQACPRIALTHPSLQVALFEVCAVPGDEAKRSQLRNELNKLAGGRREWPAIAARLRKGFAAHVVQLIEKYLSAPWKPDFLKKKLPALLHGRLAAGHVRQGALAAVKELDDACTGAKDLGVSEDMLVVDPRLSLSEVEFPSGLQLQVSTPRHSVLMRGGRFDSLLVASGGERRVACGLTIATKRLLEAAAEGRPSSSTRPGNELEVCVCSPESSLAQRMQLVSLLWREGVRADLSHEGDPGSQVAQAAMLGVAIVAMLSEHGDTVTIKALRRKEEQEEVPFADAVKHIKQVLHAQSLRSIGRFKPRQGSSSPQAERRVPDQLPGNANTALKVPL
mmetsp:Transcript_10976/g.33847  ORF Transcript_10976/g.33847 Transcript_10976/m.33847 type:complete len:1072 (-) Transcript_10976:818-4033(-)